MNKYLKNSEIPQLISILEEYYKQKLDIYISVNKDLDDNEWLTISNASAWEFPTPKVSKPIELDEIEIVEYYNFGGNKDD